MWYNILDVAYKPEQTDTTKWWFVKESSYKISKMGMYQILFIKELRFRYFLFDHMFNTTYNFFSVLFNTRMKLLFCLF